MFVRDNLTTRKAIEWAVKTQRRTCSASDYSALARLLLLYSTQLGLTVSPDSVIYLTLRTARTNSSYSAFQYGKVGPLTHYPPLFPAVLAAAIKSGLTAEAAARVLNVAMYAATVATTAIVLQRLSGSRATAIAGAAFTLFAPTVFAAFTKLLSEPLMLPLVTGRCSAPFTSERGLKAWSGRSWPLALQLSRGTRASCHCNRHDRNRALTNRYFGAAPRRAVMFPP
jgi:hypothetical protein